jgi:hypothetical protein
VWWASNNGVPDEPFVYIFHLDSGVKESRSIEDCLQLSHTQKALSGEVVDSELVFVNPLPTAVALYQLRVPPGDSRRSGQSVAG